MIRFVKPTLSLGVVSHICKTYKAEAEDQEFKASSHHGGSEGKTLAEQSRQPEFKPWDPSKSGRREPVPHSLPLTTTCAL